MNRIIKEDIDFILQQPICWDRFKNKSIFITGGYGMLLSYMTFALLKLNEINPELNITINILVHNEERAKRKLKMFIDNRNLKFCKHDLLFPLEIDDNINFIVHGASSAFPHFVDMDPGTIIVPNVVGTFHLLELARKKNVESFLFISSGAVYGLPIKGEVVSEDYYGYLNFMDAKNCYGESKRMAENMCKCWFEKFQVPIKIVRPAHVYGPTMDIKNDKRLMADFVKRVIEKKDLVIRGDGAPKRSFCYVADATVALCKVLLDGTDGEAYNVSNVHTYISVKELAEIFLKVFPQKKLRIMCTKDKNIISNTKKLGEKMLMSSNKLEKLGWKPQFTLEEGIRRTVESYIIDEEERNVKGNQK